MPGQGRSVAGVVLVVLLAVACSPEAGPGGAEAPDGDDGAAPPEAERDPAPEEPEEPEEPPPGAPDAQGVSAGHPDAVAAGVDVLEQGGTAADAAVAAAFASGVVEPFTSGLGGGGSVLVLEQGAEPRAYDYSDVVPEHGEVPASGTGVPGFVAGMERLSEEHGALDFATLVEPSIELAQGAEVSELLAQRLARDAGALPVGRLPHLYPDGAALTAGETMVQEELAETLRAVATGGAQGFYEGAVADTLAAEVPGIDAASLAGYDVQSTPPPTGRVGELEVIGAAPPLPGTSLVQQLQIADGAGVGELAPGSADTVHVLAASWRIALAHQERELGDPAVVDVPVDELTDPERNHGLAEEVTLDAVPPADTGLSGGDSDPNTTHITAVDDEGTMVSMTNTLTNFWGSRQYAEGFFLNDHLRRFDLGRDGVNEPGPGRRPVTWSLPVIVADDEGRPVLGLGSPGGPRIPNVLAKAIVAWGLQDQPLVDVIEAPRFHVEGTALTVEPGLAGLAGELRSRGWRAVQERASPLYFGSVQALEIDYEAGEVRGATDPRREADHRVVSAD